MSKIRHAAVALTTVVATAAGAALTGAPQADAATCTSTPNVYCSMWWANRVYPNQVKPGVKTREIANLQTSLRQVRFNVQVTARLDSQTRTNLRNYQYSRGLKVTGVLDSSTLHALRAGAGAKRATTPKKATAASASSRAGRAVQFAYQQIGKPYIYGGNGPGGYDCSGLTSAAYRSTGLSIPRTSSAQLAALPTVSKANLRPGDLVGFYSGGHIGIYVGDGYVIHASRPGKPIAKVKMSTMPYYKSVRPAS